MPSISDRLKSLGVQVGAQNIPKPKRASFPIESVVEGEFVQTPFGQAFVVQNQYPRGHNQGKARLGLDASLQTIAAWAGDPRLLELDPASFVFLDTETSGLAGGTGTYAFLIGVGRFTEGGFRLAQYFMCDPIEEPAHLAAFNQFLGSSEGLVTFNGKAFDVPLLNTRFITNGEKTPLAAAAHLDLLPLARRLWRDRLPSRALGYLEEHILQVKRTHEDVPGWLIPLMYFDYLRNGDARPLKKVFYHNAMDILSLAALLNHVAAILAEPMSGRVDHPVDLVAIGKLFEDLGHLDTSTSLYAFALDQDLTEESRRDALQRWSFLEKRRGNLTRAIDLWRQAVDSKEIYACEELAKYYEHREGDFEQARRWTEEALSLINSSMHTRIERQHWLPLLNHRLSRLNRKINR